MNEAKFLNNLNDATKNKIMTNNHEIIEWPEILSRKSPISNGKRFWKFGSRFVVPAVGILSKIWMNWFNRCRIHNHDVFLETVSKHYKSQGKYALLTFSNHASCMDDPFIWGALLPFKWHLNSERNRWSAAAQDICFTRGWHSTFFALGRSFPIVRGKGIYQPGMDFALEVLKEGGWIHFFPQGRVLDRQEENNMIISNKHIYGHYNLKWGLARLVLDHLEFSKNPLQILPIYHVGMDDILPSVKPYIPKMSKNLTICVRNNGPIKVNAQLLKSWEANTTSVKTNRSKIMKALEEELSSLGEKALSLHKTAQIR